MARRNITRNYTTAIALLRTSKEDGDTKKGIEAQRDFIVDYATRSGITIVNFLVEDGVSGAAPIECRQRLQEALQAIKEGHADILLTYDITRVARDIGIFGTIRKMLQTMNAKGLTSYDDEYTNPEDDFSSFKAVFAEYERKSIARRLYAGRRVKSKSTGMGSGTLPWGYTYDTHGAIIVDSEAAKTIMAVLQCRKSMSYRKAAAWLNEQGYTTAEGTAWANSSIQRVEKNAELYTTGKRTWADITASEAWPIVCQ